MAAPAEYPGVVELNKVTTVVAPAGGVSTIEETTDALPTANKTAPAVVQPTWRNPRPSMLKVPSDQHVEVSSRCLPMEMVVTRDWATTDGCYTAADHDRPCCCVSLWPDRICCLGPNGTQLGTEG